MGERENGLLEPPSFGRVIALLEFTGQLFHRDDIFPKRQTVPRRSKRSAPRPRLYTEPCATITLD